MHIMEQRNWGQPFWGCYPLSAYTRIAHLLQTYSNNTKVIKFIIKVCIRISETSEGLFPHSDSLKSNSIHQSLNTYHKQHFMFRLLLLSYPCFSPAPRSVAFLLALCCSHRTLWARDFTFLLFLWPLLE